MVTLKCSSNFSGMAAQSKPNYWDLQLLQVELYFLILHYTLVPQDVTLFRDRVFTKLNEVIMGHNPIRLVSL